jgi:hypothetical protein
VGVVRDRPSAAPLGGSLVVGLPAGCCDSLPASTFAVGALLPAPSAPAAGGGATAAAGGGVAREGAVLDAEGELVGAGAVLLVTLRSRPLESRTKPCASSLTALTFS